MVRNIHYDCFIQEMDTPHNLMQNVDSYLYGLAKDSGENAFHELKEMAASNASI